MFFENEHSSKGQSALLILLYFQKTNKPDSQFQQ